MERLSERAEALILDLCYEAGDQGTDRDLIDGFRGNHDDDLIEQAAGGDVVALIQLRIDCGLPLTR